MSLWRTARPRFNLYVPDGLGRDRYIGYNNGGFWKTNEYSISRKSEYEYPKYSNFHTLFHMAAPFKYYSDGSGRDSYILRGTGLSHDEKPLASYKLTDFLRTSSGPLRVKGPLALSQAEIKFNKRLKHLENGMIKRLYSEPLNKILEKKKITEEKMKDDGIVDVNFRENENFDNYDKNLEKNEVLENDNDVNLALGKSRKVEKYEIEDENSMIHKGNHGYLKTHNNFHQRYQLNAKPKRFKKVKVSKIEINV